MDWELWLSYQLKYDFLQFWPGKLCLNVSNRHVARGGADGALPHHRNPLPHHRIMEMILKSQMFTCSICALIKVLQPLLPPNANVVLCQEIRSAATAGAPSPGAGGQLPPLEFHLKNFINYNKFLIAKIASKRPWKAKFSGASPRYKLSFWHRISAAHHYSLHL